jgi:hypothetical protein
VYQPPLPWEKQAMPLYEKQATIFFLIDWAASSERTGCRKGHRQVRASSFRRPLWLCVCVCRAGLGVGGGIK